MSEQYIPDGEDQEGYAEWLDQKTEIESLRAEIARLREERRWVPVGKRLPTVQGDDVLTLSFFSDGSPLICLGWHNGREWMQYHGRGPGLPVTYWQPLPPGPEAAG